MIIPLSSIHTKRAAGSKTRTPEQGFAVFVVIVLLAIMASLAIGNNVALAHLQRELRLIDKRHQMRHESEKGTNAPPTSTIAATPERAAGLSESSERLLKE